MGLLRIRKYPEPVLTQRAQPVGSIDGRLAGLIEEMALTMHAASGVGLAAPQVGESSRVIVVDADREQPGRRLLKLINPTIAERSGAVVWEEACLSVVDFKAEVRRSAKVLVRAWTPEEKEVEFEAEGLLAVIFQHEIDHLDGKLFIDRISRIKRELYRRKLRKMIKEGSLEKASPPAVLI